MKINNCLTSAMRKQRVAGFATLLWWQNVCMMKLRSDECDWTKPLVTWASCIWVFMMAQRCCTNSKRRLGCTRLKRSIWPSPPVLIVHSLGCFNVSSLSTCAQARHGFWDSFARPCFNHVIFSHFWVCWSSDVFVHIDQFFERRRQTMSAMLSE